jgi:DNA-binding transcriptional regulator YhcF (GntR family)
MNAVGGGPPPEVRETMARIYRELHDDPPGPDLPSEQPLDEVLASRSHIRMLRTLVLLGDRINLTGRDLARRAGVSHPRSIEVIRDLKRAGVIKSHPGSNWAIHELSKDSPVAQAIRALFETERDLTPA